MVTPKNFGSEVVLRVPTVNAAVRARVRTSKHGRNVPKYKAARRLYFSPNVDAKNITGMPRKLSFMWCYFLVEMFAQNVHISPQSLGEMGHRIIHF